MFGFLVYFSCVVLAGFFAAKRGRSMLGWAIVAVVATPIIAVLALLVLDDKSKLQAELELEDALDALDEDDKQPSARVVNPRDWRQRNNR